MCLLEKIEHVISVIIAPSTMESPIKGQVGTSTDDHVHYSTNEKESVTVPFITSTHRSPAYLFDIGGTFLWESVARYAALVRCLEFGGVCYSGAENVLRLREYIGGQLYRGALSEVPLLYTHSYSLGRHKCHVNSLGNKDSRQ